jgi:hypothetical protein
MHAILSLRRFFAFAEPSKVIARRSCQPYQTLANARRSTVQNRAALSTSCETRPRHPDNLSFFFFNNLAGVVGSLRAPRQNFRHDLRLVTARKHSCLSHVGASRTLSIWTCGWANSVLKGFED